jgi:predicted nucleic acid-binding protein
VIVLDASAALELLLRTLSGRLVETRVFSGSESLHAPHLIGLEVIQVRRRNAATGTIAPHAPRQR